MTSIKNLFKSANISTPKITSVNSPVIDTIATPAKTILEDITEHIPDFITENAGKIASKASDIGKNFIDNIHKNPITYAAAIGAGSLVAGIAMGRISKPEKEDNIETEMFHLKITDKTNS